MKIYLQLLAVLITVVGYFGSRADKFPLVTSLLASDYAQAKKGIEILWSDRKELAPGSPGFNQITEILRKKITPKEQAQTAVFEKLVRGKGGLKFGATAVPFAEIEVHIKNNPILTWDLKKLETEIKELFDKRIFTISGFVFWFGVVINIALIFWKQL